MFQSNENAPVATELAIKYLIELMITRAANLRTRAGILSRPLALETTNALKSNNLETFERLIVWKVNELLMTMVKLCS